MGREGIQLFGDGVSKKEREDGHWKSKAFNFLVVLRIPVKECLQYDNKIEMLTS